MNQQELKPIKKGKTWIDNIAYETEEYSTSAPCYCTRCRKTTNEKKVFYYYNRGMRMKICPKCFKSIETKHKGKSKKSQTVTNTTKASKAKKKQYNENFEKNIVITDPTITIAFGDDFKMSLIEVYFKNQNLYNKILTGGKPYYYKTTDEIKSFLKSNRKIAKKKGVEIAIEQLIELWRKNHRVVEDPISSEIQNLIELTLKKEIIWQEELNFQSRYTVEQKFFAKKGNNEYRITISGHRNIDNEMKTALYVQKKNKDGKTSNYGKKTSLKIYNAVRSVGVLKKENINSSVSNSKKEKEKKIIAINSNDFVVRTNLFKCYHNEHKVEEIIGIVKVIDRFGVEREKRIPCAYCPECKCFFMLISEYKKLSSFGIILCQLIDKDEYYQNGNLNSFNYSSESLLMINGYNVKANNGLTEAQRHAILKNIIENRILTPHRIVSYLDMFIAQKTHMPQYKEAVDKWKKDRNYVLNYKNAEKRTVKIESIKR